jgi:hypothetical protein
MAYYDLMLWLQSTLVVIALLAAIVDPAAAPVAAAIVYFCLR